MGWMMIDFPKSTLGIARFAVWFVGLLSLAAYPLPTATAAEPSNPVKTLDIEAKIPLGDIHGRIDHLAVDPGRQRLYVAELGNDSIGAVDLKASKIIRTLSGFHAPQGVAYVHSTDTVFVASAGDGSVRLFQGPDLTPVGNITLGSDADNVRVDEQAHRVFVGYGDGAIAVIDADSRRKIADIALHAHPESFQLEPSGQRIVINVPDAHEIAVADRATNKQIASWPPRDLDANFPLALDEPHQKILVVFRHPAKIGTFSMNDGHLLSAVNTCGDADDLFIDQRRNRIYVSCGAGFIDVLAGHGESYVSIGRIPTASGARTSLFVPALDRFFLAVRSAGATPASIWVFRPVS
jgi:DNA-binding beta-propeller fold protein YncE